MADIRINSLPSTATSFNTDDYIAIDGASGGTRRMLAATLPLTDVTFGSSGPSAKSSIAARAARQGLVFDGTAGSTVSFTPGSGNFSFSTNARLNSIGSIRAIVGGTVASTFVLYVNASGKVVVSNNSSDLITGNTTLVANRNYSISYVRSGTTGTIYIDGISDATGTDSTNYSNASTQLGSSGGTYFFDGFISSTYVYNRALSAAEVVALYEAGVPAGGDYPTTAAGTDNVTNGNFSSSTGWAVGSAWTISGGVATTNGTGDGGGATELAQTGKSFKAGQRVRVTYTLASVTSGSFRIIFYGGTSNVYTTTRTSSGTYTEEITLTGGATAFQTTSGVTALNNGATLDNLSIISLGLLLAPDAGQAGGGLTWYDTSGNAANITLPASGVSWNVPFAGYLTAPVSSDLTLAGGNSGSTLTLKKGTSLKAGLNIAAPTGYANTVFHINDTSGSTSSGIKLTNTTTGTTNDDGFDLTVTGSNALLIQRENAYMGFYTNATETMRLFANGNLFIGASPVDGGQKLQVSGTGYFSSTLTTGGNFQVGAAQADIGAFLVETIDGSDNIRIGARRTGTNKPANLQLVTSSASNTYNVALTLDSSQNATFAGATVNVSKAGNNPSFKATDGAVITKLQSQTAGDTTGAIGTESNHTLKLITNNTTALTLDASQNATFAGNVAIQSGKALRLYNPANSAFASIEMDSNNVVNVNYTTAFGVTIRTQGGSASTPASASAAGVAGTIQWDANYIYVCTAANTWKRVAIATW